LRVTVDHHSLPEPRVVTVTEASSCTRFQHSSGADRDYLVSRLGRDAAVSLSSGSGLCVSICSTFDGIRRTLNGSRFVTLWSAPMHRL
jgi:hypothetical protein